MNLVFSYTLLGILERVVEAFPMRLFSTVSRDRVSGLTEPRYVSHGVRELYFVIITTTFLLQQYLFLRTIPYC